MTMGASQPQVRCQRHGNPDYDGYINITLPDGIELMNKEGIKAEVGIATALIRIGEKKGT